jgi:hypothetical protein
MTKTINNIVQNDSGGDNPETHVHEDKVWELQFDDDEITTLTRSKMNYFLTKGTVPAKAVHEFRKWEITTVHGVKLRTWVVVYDDKSHLQLTNADFYSLLSNGHRNRDEEIQTNLAAIDIEDAKEKEHFAPQNPILFEGRQSLTSPDERKEIDEFRGHVIKEDYSPV